MDNETSGTTTLYDREEELFKIKDENVNYYTKVKTFANSIGFYMSCSNGIFTLSPTPILHHTHTEEHEKEVEKFKRENPVYANMKGIKHQEPSYVNYNLKVGSNMPGIRYSRMLRMVNSP
jgi:hypothetical protein